MKHLLHVVPAVLGILFGSIMLLPILARASLQDPRLEGAEYWWAVIGFFLRLKVGLAALIAMGTVVLGIAQILRVVLLGEVEGEERRQMRPSYWIALVIGTVAMISLLVGVNYLGLQAGEVMPISRMIDK